MTSFSAVSSLDSRPAYLDLRWYLGCIPKRDVVSGTEGKSDTAERKEKIK